MESTNLYNFFYNSGLINCKNVLMLAVFFVSLISDLKEHLYGHVMKK